MMYLVVDRRRSRYSLIIHPRTSSCACSHSCKTQRESRAWSCGRSSRRRYAYNSWMEVVAGPSVCMEDWTTGEQRAVRSRNFQSPSSKENCEAFIGVCLFCYAHPWDDYGGLACSRRIGRGVGVDNNIGSSLLCIPKSEDSTADGPASVQNERLGRLTTWLWRLRCPTLWWVNLAELVDPIRRLLLILTCL